MPRKKAGPVWWSVTARNEETGELVTSKEFVDFKEAQLYKIDLTEQKDPRVLAV